ncbi:MAG: dihydrolipoyl dehydrogenase [Methylococcaceae bacterium]
MLNQHSYDVIVIGAGPAGYSCAIRCAQLGLKTVCIDDWRDKLGQSNLGGTYLNAGCVASMALLDSSRLYHSVKYDLKKHGIHADNVSVDIKKMIQRKDDLISDFGNKIANLFEYHHIERLHGKARLLAARKVEVKPADGSESFTLTAPHIVLATGSSPIELPCAPIDNKYIVDSTTALNFPAVPQKLAIIGAGIIGLELGGIWQRLGAETIILEAQENFLPLVDAEIAVTAYHIYRQQGLDLRLGARVISTKKLNKKVIVDYQDQHGTHTLTVDKLIVAPGRKPNTDKLAAAEANLLLDESGFVHVNDVCRTNLPGVYAIGDLTLLGPMLAHKGIEEGIFVAEQIAGINNPINYAILPSVIYTDPEIAWVGQTEQALNAMGEPIKIGVFPLTASARANAMNKTEGLVKIIAHAENDSLLGVHIIGANASELIAEAVLAMEFSASSEDLARTIHAHPTLSESLYEAAQMIKQRSLHLPLTQ